MCWHESVAEDFRSECGYHEKYEEQSDEHDQNDLEIPYGSVRRTDLNDAHQTTDFAEEFWNPSIGEEQQYDAYDD